MLLEGTFGISTKPSKHGIHVNVTQSFGNRYSDYATGCMIRGSIPDGGRDFSPLQFVYHPALKSSVSSPQKRSQ